ncbi:WhiB family transcriptional regulator [Micromonospora sp. WMMD723]|uniref:WhiB family transcriptional regulator n=1 Tax=Micromonospora sp. WMMD723 TaxID=3403465 RepID=UPI003CF9FC56
MTGGIITVIAEVVPGFLRDRTVRPACVDADPGDFFPEPESVAAAAAVRVLYCQGCAVYGPCLDWALSQPVDKLHGLWAGTNQGMRRRMRTQRAP